MLGGTVLNRSICVASSLERLEFYPHSECATVPSWAGNLYHESTESCTADVNNVPQHQGRMFAQDTMLPILLGGILNYISIK